MRPQKFYVGRTLSWDWREDWKKFVELAKRLRCRFDAGAKRWEIPSVTAAIEIVRSLLELGVNAVDIDVRDYNSFEKVSVTDYIDESYLRKGVAKVLGLPVQLTIEDRETVYLSIPLDRRGEPAREHELLYGLAVDGCGGVWHDGKGFKLMRFVREAVDYVVRTQAAPVVGVPRIGDTPFICSLYPELLEHQETGVRFLVERQGAILADDMGLGKTMQSILAANQMHADERAETLLVVCPVSLLGNWRNELRRWESSFSAVHLVPYSQLDKLPRLAAGGRSTVAVFDEAHYLKNPASNRTKAVMKYLTENAATRRWFLTGTPVTRDFKDIWAMAFMLGHPAHQKYRPSEMAKLPENRILRLSGSLQTHMLMRKKSDVLSLPPKIRQIVQFDTNLERMLKLAEEELKRIVEENPDAGGGTREGYAYEFLMRLKRLCAEAKAPETAKRALAVLEAGRKVVIFSDHVKAMEMIHDALQDFGCVVVDGSVTGEKRTAAVARFQADPKTRVFLGQIKAAGVGLTLTAAADVLFNDLTWLPADMHQAEDRCHRIGAKEQVQVQYIVDCNLPIDHVLCEKLAERSAEIATFEQSKQTVLEEVRKWAAGQLAGETYETREAASSEEDDEEEAEGDEEDQESGLCEVTGESRIAAGGPF